MRFSAPRVKKEFAPWIAGPAADIFNTITRSGEYPRSWVKEYVTPIPKSSLVESLDDLRLISILEDLVKDYNNLVARWIQPIIEKRMDPAQMGGIKGHSITHYLILLFNFIFSHASSKHPAPQTYATIASILDYSKGFTRMSHNQILTRLSDWKTPGWLLKVIASYLTDRKMIVRYKGAV